MRIKRFSKLIVSIVLVWIVFVIAGLVFSRSMQDKIIKILSEQANKYIVSEIQIRKSDIHFSVFQKFPLASIELKNICVKIPSTFDLPHSKTVKGDTLLFAKKVYLQMNLMSLMNKKYELRKIALNDGFLQVLTDKNGNSSLDIFRSDTSGKKSNVTTDIKSFSVTNLFVYNTDIIKRTFSVAYFDKGIASGKFASSNFAVTLKTNGVLKQLEAKNQRLEPNQQFSVDVSIEKNKQVFAIRKGMFTFSNIPFKAVGTIRSGNNTLIDLIFSANKVPVRQIDKALLKGLLGENGIEFRNGLLDIQSTFIGYTKNTLPAIKANFKITNGKVYDNLHNILLEGLYLSGQADNGKEHLPKSFSIRLDTFNFTFGKSTQWGKLKIVNLITPQIAVYSRGHVYYGDIKSFNHIPDVDIHSGEFNDQLAIAAIIDKSNTSDSRIMKDVTARAKVDIVALNVDFPSLKIPQTTITGQAELVDNDLLKLSNLTMKSGNTDITLNGTLTQFSGKKAIPFYQGKISSNVFQADEFFGVDQQAAGEPQPIKFPDSISVSGDFNIATFKYGKFETDNAKGSVRYENKSVDISDFTMDGFDGYMNGITSLSQDNSGNIALYTNSNISNVDVKKLFYACDNFDQDFIGYQSLDGSISGHVELKTAWTNKLEFIPSSVISQSEIVLNKGEIKDYEPLLGLSKFIKVEELKDIKFEKLTANISIHNEEVYLDKTRVVSSAISFDCSGAHGFDNKYEYRLQLALSDLLWKKAKSKNTGITEFGYIVDDGVGQTIVPFIISGVGTAFDVKYDKKAARNRFKEKVGMEKMELKELFSGKERKRDNSQTNDAHNTEPAKLEKTDSGKYRTRSDDFILEWDDSEDSGSGNNN